MTLRDVVNSGECNYSCVHFHEVSNLMPGLPKSWIDRRRRKLRRIQREAIARIGLSTAGSPAVGETTLCIAYMCPWAHNCSGATHKPALVNERDCLRKFPEERRPDSGLSDQALDNLAKQRDEGIRLGAVTIGVLDEFRPTGPTRSLNQKKPERPVYDSGVRGKPFLPTFDQVSTVRRTSK